MSHQSVISDQSAMFVTVIQMLQNTKQAPKID